MGQISVKIYAPPGSLLSNNQHTGIHERGEAFMEMVLATMRSFTAFDSSNDPYHEHDFGAFTLGGERVFFKIDYYDLALAGHSPDPADPTQTHRVLTAMLASEY